MIRIAVLYGGKSGEHDVSRCSAASVIGALDPNKYEVLAIGIDRSGKWHVQESPEIINDADFGQIMKLNETGLWLVHQYDCNGKLKLTEQKTGKEVEADVVFPVMHGTNCEDGTLQGLLELSNVPFIGPSMLGSAIGMDKDVSKKLLRDADISVVPWLTFQKHQWIMNEESVASSIISEFSFPIFVKPAKAGSSVGVSKVKIHDHLAEALNTAFSYDSKVLVEPAIPAREIECSILGNKSIEASILGEIIPEHEFYSYEAKYIDDEGANLAIPADIDSTLTSLIRETAIKAFSVLNCQGMGRIDFFLDKECGCFYLNEINTIPGFTSISMYPKLWEYSGLKYTELLDRLVDIAFEIHEERNNLITDFKTGEKK